jgi:hypothetical protein
MQAINHTTPPLSAVLCIVYFSALGHGPFCTAHVASALGQKQTFASQQLMSALPQKANMCGAKTDVRFGPKTDMAKIATWA